MATIPPPDPENPSIFTCSRLNDTTFVIQEDDSEYERPLIYVKLPRHIPVVILSDTGCDSPNPKKKDARFTQLRDYLENAPEPLNPCGQKKYIIICTHCHYDHIGGIAQFSRRNDADDSSKHNDIVASAAGRDFAESDLLHHGLFHLIGKPAPPYPVTHWAQAFERLTYPLKAATSDVTPVDLGITILHTPGHTPDQLAWYDHSEKHLFVGDSMYFEGGENMPIIWPEADGNLIEWSFSLQKLLYFVRSENSRSQALAGESSSSSSSRRRVRLAAGHTTVAADAEEFLELCDDFFLRVLKGEVPVTELADGRCLWREEDGKSTTVSFRAPKTLVEEAQDFFMGNIY